MTRSTNTSPLMKQSYLKMICLFFFAYFVTVQNPLGFNDQLLCKTEN